MTSTPDAAADAGLQTLLALLRDGDVDAALQAGLMGYPVSTALADAPIRAAQERLRTAWEARERHRIREARLARQAAERAARRAAAGRAATAAASTTAVAPALPTPPAPALPAAAAAALARARAKAAGRPPE
jgi:hypothetical protein